MSDSRSEFFTDSNDAKVELATFVHQGKDFTNLGSVVDEGRGLIVGYPKGEMLLTWNGRPICKLEKVSTWKTPGSWVSSTQTAYRAVLNGRTYYGRGAGDGMLLKLHGKKEPKCKKVFNGLGHVCARKKGHAGPCYTADAASENRGSAR